MVQEIFEKLQNLQDILLQKYEIENEIRDIPKALVTKNELLNRLKKQYIEKSGLLDKKQEKIKSFRFKLREAEDLREKFEKDMDLIKTQREYELLDKAIKEATEREQELRKDILKEEKEIEELNQFIEREEQLINQQEEELKLEEERIENESEEKKALLLKLEEEEKKIIPGLDEEILFKFERIIKNKAGLGIVPVKGSVCTGCHMILPSQFVNDISTGQDILFCPYCSRILYFLESNDSFFPVFNDSDIGGFSDYDEDEEFEDELEDDEEDAIAGRIDKDEVIISHDDDFDDDEEEEIFDEEEEIFEEESDDYEEEFEEEEEEAAAEEIEEDVEVESDEVEEEDEEEEEVEEEDEEDPLV